MPKLIDYPRTSYAGAWEIADVVDDTGGKCALETCARKLNRKVSGSFKAIIGSAVKFGLLTSKRELLTTTTLFRRIKHAYDKQEELLFHREAFLTPPLFTQLCRKFRSRELPVQMLDIMLIREFDVEEINAQSVAKAFIDGARMVGVLDERNMVADIDQLTAQQPPRRELASPELGTNSFRAEVVRSSTTLTPPQAGDSLFTASDGTTDVEQAADTAPKTSTRPSAELVATPGSTPTPLRGSDAVASLFGLAGPEGTAPGGEQQDSIQRTPESARPATQAYQAANAPVRSSYPADSDSTYYAAPALKGAATQAAASAPAENLPRPALQPNREREASSAANLAPAPQLKSSGFRIELSGPGLNTVLDVQDEDDLALARVLLDKIGRQLSQRK